MKTRFTWSTDQETLDMLAEMAKADDRKSSPFLNRLVRKAYTVYVYEQKVKEAAQ